mgnify:CR=1 FL=1
MRDIITGMNFNRLAQDIKERFAYVTKKQKRVMIWASLHLKMGSSFGAITTTFQMIWMPNSDLVKLP